MKHKEIKILPSRPLGFRYVGHETFVVKNYIVSIPLIPNVNLNTVSLVTSLSLQPKPEPLTGWRKLYGFIFDRNRFFRTK